MTEPSSFEGLLYDLAHDPLVAQLQREASLLSPLFAEMEARNAEAAEADRVFLASLSDVARRRVLLHRRIDAVERRYRAWWEEHVAWRFRSYPDSGEDW